MHAHHVSNNLVCHLPNERLHLPHHLHLLGWLIVNQRNNIIVKHVEWFCNIKNAKKNYTPIDGMLCTILIHKTEWSLDRASSKRYSGVKPLVGWAKGRLWPSSVCTKCMLAFKTCGHLFSSKRGSIFTFSNNTANISTHSCSVWSQGPKL